MFLIITGRLSYMTEAKIKLLVFLSVFCKPKKKY